MARWTQERTALLENLWGSEKTISEIAEALSCTRASLCAKAVRMGLPNRRKRFQRHAGDKLRELWDSEKTVGEIAHHLGTSEDAVKGLSNRVGLKARGIRPARDVTSYQKTDRSGFESRTCEFPACDVEFVTARNRPSRFCSDECRRSHEIMQWAPKLLELRQQGKTHREIGEELRISRNAALIRATRLERHMEKHPMLVLALRDNVRSDSN